MKGLKYHILAFCSIISICILSLQVVFSGPSGEATLDTGSGRIDITAKTLEMNNKLKLITFSGDVNASKDEFTISCDKMVGHGVSMSDPHEKKGKEAKFDKIVATGNVMIHRSEGGDATAEEAVYYQEEEKIVLTGNPIVTRDSDVVKGGRIIIFLKEDRVVVENPDGTFAPREE